MKSKWRAVNLHAVRRLLSMCLYYQTNASLQKHPAKTAERSSFKMPADAFARFFGDGGDFVDSEIVTIHPNWRLLEELDDVFVYGDALEETYWKSESSCKRNAIRVWQSSTVNNTIPSF